MNPIKYLLSMNGGRSYADAVTNSRGQVWVTGGWDGKHRHNTTEVMIPASSEGEDAWVQGESLTFARYQHCGVTLGDGSVVITGGQEGEGKHGEALDTVERYEWGGRRLEAMPRLLEARWTHACGLVRLAGREAVIVAGGRVTSGPGDELDTVELLIIGQTRWRPRQPLPEPRLAPAMVVINNTPLLIGGNYATGVKDETFPDTALEYDVEADTWRPVARLRGRSHHAMVTIKSSKLSC